MSAQTVGILLGVFSLGVSALLFWGALAEQKRADAGATPPAAH